MDGLEQPVLCTSTQLTSPEIIIPNCPNQPRIATSSIGDGTTTEIKSDHTLQVTRCRERQKPRDTRQAAIRSIPELYHILQARHCSMQCYCYENEAEEGELEENILLLPHLSPCSKGVDRDRLWRWQKHGRESRIRPKSRFVTEIMQMQVSCLCLGKGKNNHNKKRTLEVFHSQTVFLCDSWQIWRRRKLDSFLSFGRDGILYFFLKEAPDDAVL